MKGDKLLLINFRTVHVRDTCWIGIDVRIGIESVNFDLAGFARSTSKDSRMLIDSGLHIKKGESRNMLFKNIVTLACKREESLHNVKEYLAN